tara:strand:+ start:11263 stop:12381 length:1119 start_codon:yes stop_codon:yes gene_type:complete
MHPHSACALQFLAGFASQVTSPLQAAYALEELHLTVTQLGVANSLLGAAYVGAIAYVITAAPPVRQTLWWTLVARIIASIAYACATMLPMALFTASRIVHGASLASITVCFQLAAARPFQEVTPGFARALSLCLMVGPLVGMACASVLAATVAPRTAVDACNALYVVSALASWGVAHTVTDGDVESSLTSTSLSSPTPFFHARTVLLCVACNVGFGMLTLETLAPLVAQRALHVPTAHVGSVVLPLMSVIVCSQTVALHIGDHVTDVALVFAVGAALTGTAHLSASMALLCASGAMQMSWCTGRGTVTATHAAHVQMAMQLGRCIGPLMGGVLLGNEKTDDVSGFWITQTAITVCAACAAHAVEASDRTQML